MTRTLKLGAILGLALLLIATQSSARISNPPATQTIDTSTFALKTSNLSDLASSTAARLNLGLGLTDSPFFAGVTTTNALFTNATTTKLNGYTPSRLAKRTIQWSASFATSTSSYYDPIFVFDSTSTILKVYENSTSTGNTLTYNLYYGSSNLPKAGMTKVFSSDRTIGPLAAPQQTTTFAASTPCAGCALFIDQTNASSTLTTITIYYEEQ